jgi:hypothetical protein
MHWQRILIAPAALVVLAIAGSPLRGQDAPRFDLPIACPTDAGCVVRQYVDQDPGPGYQDYHCGPLAYNGHRGTDIRVPDNLALARGVSVLAAAPGIVFRLRDDMPDVSVRQIGREAVKDRAAGNAVVIDHGNGWQTSYWHLRQGSVAVKEGDRIAGGQPIALIGLSGDTEFVHLHFEIRHNDKPIDPFNGLAIGSGCGASGQPLWTPSALARLAYVETWLFGAGFAPTKPDEWSARAGAYAQETLPVGSPALVFWIDVIGRRPGDQEMIRLLSHDGTVLSENSDTVSETRVQWFQFVGRKRPATGWLPGRYRGEYTLTRTVDGQSKAVIDIKREIELR